MTGDKVTWTEKWIPRILFVLTLGCAVGLASVVWGAPLLLADDSPRVLELFAEDLLVRRTALASALGLLVTAFVFFRPPGIFPSKRQRKPPPAPIAGA